jgi:hypothetical protein
MAAAWAQSGASQQRLGSVEAGGFRLSAEAIRSSGSLGDAQGTVLAPLLDGGILYWANAEGWVGAYDLRAQALPWTSVGLPLGKRRLGSEAALKPAP